MKRFRSIAKVLHSFGVIFMALADIIRETLNLHAMAHPDLIYAGNKQQAIGFN